MNYKMAWIAHHEAAHAVAYMRLGLPCTEVSIMPSEDPHGVIGIPDAPEFACSEDQSGTLTPDPEICDKYAIALCAGYFSCGISGQPIKRALRMSRHDFDKVQALLPHAKSGHDDLWDQTFCLVVSNEGLIRALAYRLCKYKVQDRRELTLLVAAIDGDEEAICRLRSRDRLIHSSGFGHQSHTHPVG